MELFGIENPSFRVLETDEEIREFKRVDPEYQDNDEDEE